MANPLQAKSEEFLKRLRNDLSAAEKRYKDIATEMEEYVFVRSFITKEMEFDGQNADRKVMMNFGKQVYTKAKVKAGAKILVRLYDDLFAEMPYERALQFVVKRIDFLNQIATEYLKEIAQIKGHMTMTYAVMDPTNLSTSS